MRASSHDPLTRFWVFWIGLFEYWNKDYSAAASTMQNVMRQSPQLLGFAARYRAAALGQLGHTPEVKASLEAAIAASPTLFQQYVLRRPPWMLPDDHAHMLEGLRKAGWGDEPCRRKRPARPEMRQLRSRFSPSASLFAQRGVTVRTITITPRRMPRAMI